MSILGRLFGGGKKAKEDMFRNITRNVNPQTHWTVLSLLGEGTFGKVHKVKRTCWNVVVCWIVCRVAPCGEAVGDNARARVYRVTYCFWMSTWRRRRDNQNIDH